MRLAIANKQRDAHPVDLVEQIAHIHDWSFERTAEDEITVCVAGEWADYHVSFSWLEEVEALHLACGFDMRVPENRKAETGRLVSDVNGKLLIGHFDFWENSGSLVYRQALLLAGGIHPSDMQVETLLLNAVEACENYYSAFQMVAWSSLPADQALKITLFETVGNA